MALGIDAAGLALAIFPVVISTVDWYSGRIKGRDIKHLAESLKNNERIFLNSVEQLLRCVVPPAEAKELLDDLEGDGWKSPTLSERVVDHLGDQAEEIRAKIGDIYHTILKLKDKLPTRSNAASDPSLKERAKIVMKSFVHGSQYKASLDRLRTSVDEFRKLTKDVVKLAPLRGILPKRLRDLKLVHDCADGLYHAVQERWQCECTEPHPANMRLDVWCVHEEASDNLRLKFGLLFADDARLAHSDHWVDAELTQDNKDRVADLINDLCALMKQGEDRPRPTRRGRLGSISHDAKGLSYDLISKPDQPTTPPTRSSVNLAAFFKEQNKLTNKNRVQLALTLAWGVLQISSTSWLSGSWTKDNILLVMDTPNKPYPYVSHRFDSTRRMRRSSTLDPAATYRIADWVKNASVFALGVFMLEVCYNRSIEDLAIPEEKDADGKQTPHTTLLTVMRLSNVVGEELGMRYAEAVRACLHLPGVDLDERGRPTDASQFARSMMRHVIDPLKTVAESFST